MTDVIAGDGAALSEELLAMRKALFPPVSKKTLRSFSSVESAKLIGIGDAYLRQLSLGGKGPQPEIGSGGRRWYSLDQINQIRAVLDENSKSKNYVHRRRPGEHCQVMAVVNFKGGSGKTTTAAHLAQYLALQGYRVLGVDLDPQASMTALHGYQPEYDIQANETMYAAIRYDDKRRPLSEIIKPTYFTGLDLIPGNLELMEYEHDTPRALAERSTEPFFGRVASALGSVEARYDVIVIDCPPQLGFLTLGALCASTGLLITAHPQMLDVMSMSQFLSMTSELMAVVERAGGRTSYDWMRYLVTRFEPNDGPQSQMTGFMRAIFGNRMLQNPMLKSTAVSDAGVTKQTLYEVERSQFTRGTYDRAMDSLTAVNTEIEALLRSVWGRK